MGIMLTKNFWMELLLALLHDGDEEMVFSYLALIENIIT